MVAKERFDAIKRKYPELKGWLALSSRLGQVDLDSDAARMLAEFPEMFVADDAFMAARQAVDEIARVEKAIKDAVAGAGRRGARSGRKSEPSAPRYQPENVDQLRLDLATSIEQLEVLPDTQVEIRFHELNYRGVIDPLLNDPLIDRARSPRASIRIVIGTLSSATKKRRFFDVSRAASAARRTA